VVRQLQAGAWIDAQFTGEAIADSSVRRQRFGVVAGQGQVRDQLSVQWLVQRADRSVAAICRHLEDIGALREDVDAWLASRIITYFYGIDGLLRTRDVFGWSLERSNEWLSAHVSAALLPTARSA
jgi:hypothetical protein